MLRAIVLSLVLLWSGLACAQVTLDANATAAVSGLVSGTITNNNLTVGTGSNRCLVAQLNFYSGGATPTGVAVTWNGVTLTQIGTEGTAFLFGLVNPASGNHALVATWTGGSLYAALNSRPFSKRILRLRGKFSLASPHNGRRATRPRPASGDRPRN